LATFALAVALVLAFGGAALLAVVFLVVDVLLVVDAFLAAATLLVVVFFLVVAAGFFFLASRVFPEEVGVGVALPTEASSTAGVASATGVVSLISAGEDMEEALSDMTSSKEYERGDRFNEDTSAEAKVPSYLSLFNASRRSFKSHDLI